MLINNLQDAVNIPVKLHHLKETKSFIKQAKKAGQRVVIVTGCFDLLHNGHVRFLKQAKTNGDVLVVGIEDDHRVRAFKGPFRPVNSILQRVEVMEALEFVDFVFVISGSPKVEPRRFYTILHKILGADALAITEGDPNIQARKEQINAVGGELITCSLLINGSTTSLIRRFLSETNFPNQFIKKEATIKERSVKSLSYWEQLELPKDFNKQDNSKK